MLVVRAGAEEAAAIVVILAPEEVAARAGVVCTSVTAE
jgi:hypothetical protein